MSDNPYAAPSTPLAPAPGPGDSQPLVFENTQRVSPSRGFRWLLESWPMFRASPLAWVLSVIIFFALTLVLQFVPVVGFIAVTAITPVLIAGFMYGCAAQTRGEPFTIEHLFAAFSDGKLGNYLLLALLQLVILFALMLLFGGLVFASVGMDALLSGEATGEEFVPVFSPLMLLAIVVGVVLMFPIMGLYYFAPALIALGGLDLVPAIRHSLVGALVNIVPLLAFTLVVVVASVIATIPLGLGWLVLMPMLIIAAFIAYRDIYTSP